MPERPGRFLSSLTHELRTPLGSILILAEMVSHSPDAESASRGKKIHRLAEDLGTLIDEVGELARLDSDRGRIHFEDIDLQALADAIEHTLGKAIPAARPVIVSKATNLPQTLRTDPRRVLQIVDAVAASAEDADGYSLMVRVEPEPNHQDPPDRLAIQLVDTALTLSPDELGGLFQPFGAPSKGTRRAHGGQSLRLAIAHRLATLLGGDLQAQSQPDGVGFTLLLPINVPPQA